jgi:hypothetical protein
MPQSLLGPNGYFPKKQPNLETLRLITDGSCIWDVENDLQERRLALSAFSRLKRLSWKGLSSEQDLETLADVLQQRSRQLQELEIDLTYHEAIRVSFEGDEDDGLGDGSTFSAEILRLPKPGVETFSNLRLLDLTAVSFTPGNNEREKKRTLDRIYNSFDFGTLLSLRLRHCQGWEALLELLTCSTKPMRLKSLEIQSSHQDDAWDEYNTLIAFIQTFQGLEELAVYTTAPLESIDLWQAMLHHRTTLRRFVQHQRSLNLREEETDLPDLSFCDPEDANKGKDGSGNPLGQLDLVSLGLCCIPRFMVRTLHGI